MQTGTGPCYCPHVIQAQVAWQQEPGHFCDPENGGAAQLTLPGEIGSYPFPNPFPQMGPLRPQSFSGREFRGSKGVEMALRYSRTLPG